MAADIGLRLRLVIEGRGLLGPGKAALLEGIRDTGSIAAAGRRLRMSYKRAWGLVEAMNNDFSPGLVDAAKGGVGGGGAVLSANGRRVLGEYRALEAACEAAAAGHLSAIRDGLASNPGADAGGTMTAEV